MARPRRDGLPPKAPNRRKLTDSFLRGLKAEDRCVIVWDEKVRGLAIAAYPSGTRTWKCIYSFRGRKRWYTVGPADVIELDEARKMAAKILLTVATGVDPQAERRANRSADTFEELQARYLDEYAKKNNRSWRQADKLIRRNVMPRWAKLKAADISRADVKAIMSGIESPSTANQVVFWSLS